MAATDISSLEGPIKAAVQPKLMENGWVIEENDTTLSEYVTMMIINGKNLQSVQSELGNDLLGVGEDDPAVGDFARWLFDHVQALSAPPQIPQQQAQNGDAQQHNQPIPTVQDSQMEDTPATADAPYVSHSLFYNHRAPGAYARHMPHHPYLLQQQLLVQQLMYEQHSPTGPRSMRNGSVQRGRGGRMLGQMNRQMDRNSDLPDSLRRIKGAAGGQSGRINAHAGRDGPPRGPKSGLPNMTNGGRGRLGPMNNMNNINPMMNGGAFNPAQQMQFMQMMEQSAQLMAQALQQNGGMNFGNQRGAHRGGRGGQRGARTPQSNKLHAVDGKLPDGPLSTINGQSGMDVDGEEHKSDKFSTLCRFNLACTNPTCEFAHQSPAAPPNTSVDLADTCAHGVACTNHKCSGRHPSPAQRGQHKQEVDCKFYPNCTNAHCPFRHPTARPCRNGADCNVAGCTFAHSKIMCRYNPCLNSQCPFKHAENQKRGNFDDKVWSAKQDGEGMTAERFADFSKQMNGEQEELILPGQQNGDSITQEENQQNEVSREATDSQQTMDTEIAT